MAQGLCLVETEAGRSVVYHHVKAELPPGTSLLATALDEVPKAKGLTAGSTRWLRDRLG